MNIKFCHSTKIQASTLVEVLVAMVIVMITFSISLMIYVNVMNSSRSPQKTSAFLLLAEKSADIKLKMQYLDGNTEEDNIKITFTFLPFRKQGDRLQILLLEAFDMNGKKITERKELIIAD